MFWSSWEDGDLQLSLGFTGVSSGKEPACHCGKPRRCRFHPWVGKIPWRRTWHPTPVFLPGKSHWQRSLWSIGSQSWTQLKRCNMYTLVMHVCYVGHTNLLSLLSLFPSHLRIIPFRSSLLIHKKTYSQEYFWKTNFHHKIWLSKLFYLVSGIFETDSLPSSHLGSP